MTQPRTFDSLRAKPQEPSLEQMELSAAAYRFSQTPDGKTILAWMEKEVEIVVPVDAPDGALRELNGARRFRAKLLLQIERGRQERAGSKPAG